METSFGPPVLVSSGALGEVQEADRQIARWTAARARAVARFAATRPASADRQQGERGAMSAERWAARPEVLRPVSEWAAPELVVALSRSSADVERLLERSLLLVELPGVLTALEAGALTDAHLWPFLDLLAPVASAEVRPRWRLPSSSGWPHGRPPPGSPPRPSCARSSAGSCCGGARGRRRSGRCARCATGGCTGRRNAARGWVRCRRC